MMFALAAKHIAHAMELMLSNRAPTLVVGGAYTSFNDEKWAESDTTTEWFKAGDKLRGKEIVPLKICRNTFGEAKFVQEIATNAAGQMSCW